MRHLVAVVLVIACARPESSATRQKGATAMKISSPAFADGAAIPSKYTCDGGDTSPPLAISDVPAGAKSLALVVDDPDAPGGTFDHWIMWNIPPNTTAIAEGQSPQGVAGRTGFGKSKYGGPCPPSGEHRYFFKLYAVDTTLNLPPSSSKADLEKAMKGHTLATAQTMGRYKRR